MVGFINKAISGFYYCESESKVYECKARGIFRNNGISPCAGDIVDFTVDSEGYGIIENVHERKNEFLRPPLANLDKLFLVVSVVSPVPSTIVIDKLIAVCEYKNIEPIIVVTKTDLSSSETLESVYSGAGFKVIAVSSEKETDYESVLAEIKDSVSAFAGNTGVGKSTLLNSIFPELLLQTGDISKKLGRGRHTTRQVEFYNIDKLNAKVADTPGFGTMDISRYDVIRKEELAGCFREFSPYANDCKFTGCSHTSEKGCRVLEALNCGKISKSRFESYVNMYNDAKKQNDWELNK